MNAYHAVGMFAHAVSCAAFIPEEQGRVLAQVVMYVVNFRCCTIYEECYQLTELLFHMASGHSGCS